MDDEGTFRDIARRRVRAAMADRGWDHKDLAKAAGLHADTVRDFVTGVRWSQLKKRQKIAVALGWPGSAIDDMAEGVRPDWALGKRDVTELDPQPEGEIDQDSVGVGSEAEYVPEGDRSPEPTDPALMAEIAEAAARLAELTQRLVKREGA